MKHYSEDTIFGGDFDHNSMEVGDSFDMNGTRYTIERKFNEGPLRNASALYAEGCDPITAQYLATGELPG